MADLIELECWCGLPFAMPRSLYRQARGSSSVSFHCPLGHSNVFRESDADKYRREAERLKQQMAWKDDELRQERERARARLERSERSAAAYKGQVTKLRTRAKAGLCPCCNRSFQDLHRHMATKHPDFDPAENVVPFEGKAG